MSHEAYDSPEHTPVGRADGETSSGTSRVRYPEFHRVAAARVVGVPPDGRGGFRIPEGTQRVSTATALPRRVGGEWQGLPADIRNHPQVRAGAPFVPLEYDPRSQRASGTSKEVATYLQLRTLIASTGAPPQGMAELMYYWAQRGVAPPHWVEGMVAGSPQAVFLASYARRLREIVG